MPIYLHVKLEGTLDTSNGFEFTSKDVVQTFTTDKLLGMMTTSWREHAARASLSIPPEIGG